MTVCWNCYPRFLSVRRSWVSPRAQAKKFDIQRVLRKHIPQLKPYKPIEPYDVVAKKLRCPIEKIVKLDANENVYGPPKEVLTALSALEHGHIYPDPESRYLREAIGQWHGIPKENIMVGAGADELIDLILRCVLEDNEAVIDCPPTFTMYKFDVELNNGKIIEIPRLHNFRIDVPAIQSAVERENPKIIFVTSPNNPDGGVISNDELEAILKLPILVVLDEAYQEFSSFPTNIPRVFDYPNLVVLRTFSKYAALAGLRVGYGIFHSDMISYLWRAKQPYNVSVAAQVAACAALSNLSHMEEIKEKILAERERLFLLLKEFPCLEPFPSNSNFILCKVNGRSAEELKTELFSQGILIRQYNTELLNDYVRISVGRPEDTDRLMAALHSILGDKQEQVYPTPA